MTGAQVQLSARVEFCGEAYELDPATPFRIGRDADLVVDDNPYLHRRFLSVRQIDGFWWLLNDGDRLPAQNARTIGVDRLFLGMKRGGRLHPSLTPICCPWPAPSSSR